MSSRPSFCLSKPDENHSPFFLPDVISPFRLAGPFYPDDGKLSLKIAEPFQLPFEFQFLACVCVCVS